MKIAIKTRRIETAEQATHELDLLARENNLVKHLYDESAAFALSEFDAMKWETLCAQRAMLLARESELRAKAFEVPSRFRCIYEAKHSSMLVGLENSEESLSEIAA
jgi:hypothetical protein